MFMVFKWIALKSDLEIEHSFWGILSSTFSATSLKNFVNNWVDPDDVLRPVDIQTDQFKSRPSLK